MAFNRTLQHFTSSQELATQWASGQSYILDQLVLESDKLYRCILAHTSGATFAGDSANWVGINPGQTISIADGGTGQTTQTAAFDALAPTTTAGDLIVHNGTDNVRQGIGTDGQVLVVDTAQTNKLKWATIQQGSKNYIANSTFENGVTPPSSWSTFSTTIDSTTKIPSGSVTPDPTITLATSLSTPLAGTYSMLASSGAVTITTTGYGFISSAFTIDREDQAKAMGFSFYYEAASGTMNFSGTSSNTFAVYIRDVSGGAWIQPAGVYNLVQSSGVGLCSGTFQTTASGTQYQIAVLMINTVSAGVSMRFDDFRLGPQTTVQGAAISDWVSYPSTPVITVATGTVPTFSSVTGRYRRVGDSVEVEVSAIWQTATTFGTFYVGLPGSLKIDVSKLASPAGSVGNAYIRDAGITNYVGTVRVVAAFDDRVEAQFFFTNTSDAGSASDPTIASGITQVNPFTFASGDEVKVKFSVPISGWSSNTVLSQDTDTRVVAARMIRGTTQALVTGDNKILLSSATFDTHSAFDAVNSRYIAPVSGYYEISASIEAQGSATADLGFGYRLNGSGPGTTIYCGSDAAAPAAPSTFINGNDSVFLNAGSYIEFYQYISSATGTLGTRSKISVKRLSGPATIAASESVVEIRENLAGTTINPGFTKIPYTSLVKSTHSAWDLANSRFISPVSGTYQITFLYQHIYNVPGSQRPFELAIRKNGSSDILFPYRTSIQTSTDGSYGDRYAACLSATTQLNAGEYIEFYSSSANGSVNLHVQNGTNRISIFRIGN